MKSGVSRALVIGAVLLGSIAAAAGVPRQEKDLDAEGARKKIVDLNKAWGKARTTYDKTAFDKYLAPDFYVQIGDQKMTRQQFIDEISVKRPNSILKRFDVEVLTVTKQKDGVWAAVIAEKLEAEITMKDGKKVRAYSLWITKDGWKPEGDKWQCHFSEAIGFENWGGDKKPPIGW